MSGISYGKPCPKCKAITDCCSDWKPYDTTSGHCLKCGFYYDTHHGQLSLDEVNDMRKDAGLQPLEKLQPQDESDSKTIPKCQTTNERQGDDL